MFYDVGISALTFTLVGIIEMKCESLILIELLVFCLIKQNVKEVTSKEAKALISTKST